MVILFLLNKYVPYKQKLSPLKCVSWEVVLDPVRYAYWGVYVEKKGKENLF